MIATQLQVAMINKMLPKGFKFESYDTIKRQTDQSKQLKVPINKRRKEDTPAAPLKKKAGDDDDGSAPVPNKRGRPRKNPDAVP